MVQYLHYAYYGQGEIDLEPVRHPPWKTAEPASDKMCRVK